MAYDMQYESHDYIRTAYNFLTSVATVGLEMTVYEVTESESS